MRGYRVSCWGEDINIGGSNLSNVNFLNIGQQMKIIGTMIDFQTRLGKMRIKKLISQFLVRHNYFEKVWLTLTQDVKEKFIDVLSDGKGMIPYKKYN